MMRKYICLAIIVLLVFCNFSTAMSKGTNSSSSIIGDDDHLEFLMDSHSSRFLQSDGHPVKKTLDASKAIADCERGLPYGGCTPNLNNNKRIGEHCVYQGRNRNC
ncbi:hypothetical protein V6N13_052393 [Hibiscus sabdariffa]